MVISRTPFRISFFGGGTDDPAWFKEHGGSVLSTAINKYGYLTLRHLPPFFEHKHRIVYSKVELAKTISDITHPAVRAVFDFLKVEEGLELHYDGDLPAFAGIGSSSSFTVGLLHTVNALRGQMKSKRELAQEALHIEQDVLKETYRSQDQVVAAYGGLNRINFLQSGEFEVQPLLLARERMDLLRDTHMLFFTGVSGQAKQRAPSSNVPFRQSLFQRKIELVNEAQKILLNPAAPLDDWGRLLHENSRLGRELTAKTTLHKIDEVYNAGLNSGALGGRILGNGAGFVLFYVPLESQARVRAALNGMVEVPFDFDQGGSQIILYQPHAPS